jgi:dienelactone hydrolase
LAVVAAALVAAVAVSGCGILRPPGDAPLRYRDAIFSTVTITRDHQYGTAPDRNGNPVALRLDLYRPPSSDRVNKRPAIVWVHGGGFTGGDKGSGVSPDLANKFAKLGYVTVSINYRLSGPATGCVGTGFPPECITATFDAQHDAQAAIRWLRANATNYGIDPSRIAIGGESAGGITATLAGLRADDPGTSGNPGFSSSVRAFSSISGGILDGIFVDASDTAGIFFAGTADRIVPASWSVDTVNNLRAVGKTPYLELYEGAGHVPYAQFGQQMFTHTSYYFYWALDLAHAAGPSAAALE